ncbi:hypothetical protein KM1_235520 [Entamoeba histolytica HM-3:IMSS]|uniref:Uncharacterized protein n=5 Tax=Entamoeba histolytica TaxID=5759 RepID=C4MBI9_ENTH1|nr:hypothetical protein EHI_115510 [Entamoeba histolytica HM-1:IMSS]EMD46446.1 Hypothetical protein EHI5A_172790 [Entamoeba histolytica KU27]EMS12131.1 hypothetical protein KM1_235520 [Entamoeba histolytica HM-3:IMSS]ENY61075.1 hypothetical protein EHI7A_153550 [Entamoeba histolytica HM-1:IMSS-A]GAT99378.1 hypothetical protein CL6EHI_115510 [Entamoeba histolytica]EAL42483.2 hypothetical protein EHI_115510 [Entamoeba histolytica HM-1:IMSS]|eukprot:XP_647869.2 hypothetical protein EHI_115510 [Entamoeba histolytica HM-1:IMSS]
MIAEIKKEYKSMKCSVIVIPKTSKEVVERIKKNGEKYHMIYIIFSGLLNGVISYWMSEWGGMAYLISTLIVMMLYLQNKENVSKVMERLNIPVWVITYIGNVVSVIVMGMRGEGGILYLYVSNSTSIIFCIHSIVTSNYN